MMLNGSDSHVGGGRSNFCVQNEFINLSGEYRNAVLKFFKEPYFCGEDRFTPVKPKLLASYETLSGLFCIQMT